MIDALTPRTCGNCAFGRAVPSNLTQVQCFGAPPTPVVVGMAQQGPVVVSMRPQLPTAEPACGRYEAKKRLVDRSSSPDFPPLTHLTPKGSA